MVAGMVALVRGVGEVLSEEVTFGLGPKHCRREFQVMEQNMQSV